MILALIASGASLFMAWTVGADSASPSFGPVVSSRALGVLRSGLIVGVSAFLGALIQGGNVTRALGGGLVHVQFELIDSILILSIAAGMVTIGVRYHYPVPTAFTLVGAVLGAGMGAGGEVNLSHTIRLFSYWLLIPFLAGGIGYGLSHVLRQFGEEEEGYNSPQLSKSGTKVIRVILILLGIYTAYTAGASQVGLAVGPLLGTVDLNLNWLLILGGLGMLLGAWTGSPKIIGAVARDYADIGPRRAVAVLAGTSLLAQIGVSMGTPISFNEAIIAALVGSGLSAEAGQIGVKKIRFTILGWLGTFVLAFGLSYLAEWLLSIL